MLLFVLKWYLKEIRLLSLLSSDSNGTNIFVQNIYFPKGGLWHELILATMGHWRGKPLVLTTIIFLNQSITTNVTLVPRREVWCEVLRSISNFSRYKQVYADTFPKHSQSQVPSALPCNQQTTNGTHARGNWSNFNDFIFGCKMSINQQPWFWLMQCKSDHIFMLHVSWADLNDYVPSLGHFLSLFNLESSSGNLVYILFSIFVGEEKLKRTDTVRQSVVIEIVAK